MKRTLLIIVFAAAVAVAFSGCPGPQSDNVLNSSTHGNAANAFLKIRVVTDSEYKLQGDERD